MGGLFHIKYYKNTEICHITSCAYPLLGTKLFRLKFPRSCLGWWVRALCYHIPSMTSTPSAVLTRVLPPPRSPLHHGDVRAIAKWKILCYQENQVRHGEIMRVIDHQTLDAILHQQLKEQVFAFT